MNAADREFLQSLARQINERAKQRPREICIKCGNPRVCGKRGQAKLKCKKCRKEAK